MNDGGEAWKAENCIKMLKYKIKKKKRKNNKNNNKQTNKQVEAYLRERESAASVRGKLNNRITHISSYLPIENCVTIINRNCAANK